MKFLLFLCVIVVAECATLSKAPRSAARIVGGSPALIEEYPSQGSLRRSGQHTCGCVLLSTLQALTAGSCVDGQSIWLLEVYYGSADRLTGGRLTQVEAYSLHPQYDPTEDGDPNDISTITVNDTMVFDGITAAAAVLTSGNSDFHDDTCTITGWGRTSGSSSSLPEQLQMASITVLTNFDCTQRMQDVNNAVIGEGHMCAFNDVDNVGACQNDVGSPIYCFEAEGQVVAGLFSWYVTSGGVCSQNYPSVYTRFSSYMDWIPRSDQ